MSEPRRSGCCSVARCRLCGKEHFTGVVGRASWRPAFGLFNAWDRTCFSCTRRKDTHRRDSDGDGSDTP